MLCFYRPKLLATEHGHLGCFVHDLFHLMMDLHSSSWWITQLHIIQGSYRTAMVQLNIFIACLTAVVMLPSWLVPYSIPQG